MIRNYDTLTEQQQQQLIIMKDAVRDLIECPWYDDRYLFRFLQVQNFNGIKAAKIFREFVDWRTEMRVDTIVWDPVIIDKISMMRQYYTWAIHKTDREGRPVYIDKVGAADVKRMLQSATLDDFSKMLARENEYL